MRGIAKFIKVLPGMFVLLGGVAGVSPVSGQVEYRDQDLLEHYMELREEREEDDEEAADEAIRELTCFREHPLNMNEATEADLMLLQVLSALHIEHFLRYRQLFGPLVDLYELQAVPSWDIPTIRRILPYVTVRDAGSGIPSARQMLKDGEGSLLVRTAAAPEKAKGYRVKADSVNRYLGSGQKLYIKLRYDYKRMLQYGISGEKDAGEMFFKGSQRSGFDSYSFHVFLKNRGAVKALALGDYTVSMGQGLICWQGMGNGKGGEVLNVKQQAPLLKPYTAAGEYNFFRGAGILLSGNNWEGMAFLSKRKLDATLSLSSSGTVITSVNAAGYHRTPAEIEKKGNTGLLTAGYMIRYRRAHWHVSCNFVHAGYSHRIEKKAAAYNLFTAKGRRFANMGVEYSYTWRNMHFFGETAWDQQLDRASINGILMSIDSRVDLSVVHRDMSRSYESISGYAFTANTRPGNEKGIYWGISFRVNNKIRIAGYADRYYFPWLKYRVNAPSYGSAYFFQATCTPEKNTEISIRYRLKTREMNVREMNIREENGREMNIREENIREVNGREKNELIIVRPLPQQNLRFHTTTQLSPGLAIRNRAEWVIYDKGGSQAETGFLWLTDLLYKPVQSNWSLNGRIACFETDGYNSRIYAYENDVLYAAGFSPLFGKGQRYYINIRRKAVLTVGNHKKSLNIDLRWARSIYAQAGIGSGLDELEGNKKSEIKLQLVIN